MKNLKKKSSEKKSLTIPVSVLILTRNEEKRLPACLDPLRDYSEVIVIDSESADQTIQVARDHNAKTYNFRWNGQYPKKRQWSLENLEIQNDWIFFVDADEIVTDEMNSEITELFEQGPPGKAGYFIESDFALNGQRTRFGYKNTKLVLFNRHYIYFPEVDDLDCPGMGELEGHYQPVLKEEHQDKKIGFLNTRMVHDIKFPTPEWTKKHENYAKWQACVEHKKALPQDPDPMRNLLKNIFRNTPLRPLAAFMQSYFIKRGFLDGVPGYQLAKSRGSYYKKVNKCKKELEI